MPDPMFPNAQVQPPSGFFQSSRPRVIVLVHGATDRPDHKPAVGHLVYARYYWGFAFVRHLLGRGSGNLYTFSDDALDADNWPEGAYDLLTGSRMPTVAVRDDRMAHHLITANRDSRDLTVMLTHRDGSRSLAEQAEDAVNQVFELYNAAFGHGTEPQIILIGHSMGGLVSRYILCNAFRGGGTARVHLRNRADFIRNRALHLTTLCTPHDGSRFADLGRGLAELVATNGPFLQAFFDATGLPSVREVILSEFTPANDPDIRNLTSAFLDGMNAGRMSPERGRRNDGSLIPVYVLGARDPGGGKLSRPNLRAVNLGSEPRRAYETARLVVVDQVMKRAMPGGTGWGVPPPGSHDTDWVQRVSLNDLVSGAVDAAGESMPGWAGDLVTGLGGVLAASGIGCFNPKFPIYLNQRWEGYMADVPVPFKHKQYKYGPKFRVSWAKWVAATRDPSKFPAAIKAAVRNMGYNLGVLVGTLAYALNPADARCMFKPENWETKYTVPLPGVKLRTLPGRPSDGEVDNDGLVGIDSALGLTLGRAGSVVDYLDHTRRWEVPDSAEPAVGSWYRLHAGPWDWDNHGTIVYNASVGRWLSHNIVQAGPTARTHGFSAYVLPRMIGVPALRRSMPLPRLGAGG